MERLCTEGQGHKSRSTCNFVVLSFRGLESKFSSENENTEIWGEERNLRFHCMDSWKSYEYWLQMDWLKLVFKTVLNYGEGKSVIIGFLFSYR